MAPTLGRVMIKIPPPIVLSEELRISTPVVLSEPITAFSELSAPVRKKLHCPLQ